MGLLLKAGARVDAKDIYEWTPLHYAADAGHADCVLALIGAGTSVNAMTAWGSRTPLALAANEGYTGTAMAIKAAGGRQ